MSGLSLTETKTKTKTKNPPNPLLTSIFLMKTKIMEFTDILCDSLIIMI